MSNHKLVNYEGVVTTKGWVDGVWSDEQTLDYLNRAGVLGFYEYLVTKALVVPSGKQAYYKPSGKTYTPGKLIQGVRERSWEEFEAALATTPRGEDWELSDTGEEYDDSAVTSVSTPEGTTDWDKWNRVVNKLAMKYDEDGMEEVFHNLINRANQIDDAELRQEQVDNIHALVEDAYNRRLAHEQAKLSAELVDAGVSYQQQVDLGELIDSLSNDIEIRRNTRTENMSISVGHGDLHLGALAAMMTMTHNTVGLEKINELLSDAADTGSARVEMTTEEFFGVTPVDAETYRQLLDALRKDLSHEERLTKILGLSDHLSEIKSQKVKHQTEKELAALNERIEQITETVEYLETQLNQSHAIDRNIIESVSRLEDLQSLARMQRSLTSGNFMTQTVLEYAGEYLGNVRHPEVTKFLDSYFDYSLGPKGENLTDYLKGHSLSQLSNALDVSPATPRPYTEFTKPSTTVEQLKNFRTDNALANIPQLVREVFDRVAEEQDREGARIMSTNVVADFPPEVMEALMPKQLRDFLESTSDDNVTYPSVYSLAGANTEEEKELFRRRFATRLGNYLVENSADKHLTNQLRKDGSGPRINVFHTILDELGISSMVSGQNSSGQDEMVNLAQLMESSVPNAGEVLLIGGGIQGKYLNEIAGAIETAALKHGGPEALRKMSSSVKPRVKYGQGSGWFDSSIENAIDGVSSLILYQAHTSWGVGNGATLDRDAIQRGARAMLFFSGSGAKVDPKTGSFVSKDGNRYLHSRILSLARFLPPESSEGYAWSESSKAWMDKIILDRAAREGWGQTPPATPQAKTLASTIRPSKAALDRVQSEGMSGLDTSLEPESPDPSSVSTGYVPTQHDYLSVFASYQGQRKPSEFLMNNVTAGIKNLGILTDQEVAELQQVTNFNGDDAQPPASLNRVLETFMGTEGIAGKTYEQLAKDDFKGVSMSGLHSLFRDAISRGVITKDEASASLRKVARSRMKGMDKDVENYAMRLMREDLFRDTGAHTGSVLEKISLVPMIQDAISTYKRPEGATLEVVKPTSDAVGLSNVEGVRFEDVDGNIHLIGSMVTANSGAVDSSHIIIDREGNVTVKGFEVKMEKTPYRNLPHIGNVSNHAALIADMKKNGHKHRLFRDKEGNRRQLKSLTYDDTTLINVSQEAPLSSTGEPVVYAARYTTDAVSRGDRYVGAGQVVNQGQLIMANGSRIDKPHAGVEV